MPGPPAPPEASSSGSVLLGILGCAVIAMMFGGCGLFICVGLAGRAASPRDDTAAAPPQDPPPRAAAAAPAPPPAKQQPAAASPVQQQPASGSSFGTCADGTPAHCSGRGCCSHHGGTGSGRSHHKR